MHVRSLVVLGRHSESYDFLFSDGEARKECQGRRSRQDNPNGSLLLPACSSDASGLFVSLQSADSFHCEVYCDSATAQSSTCKYAPFVSIVRSSTAEVATQQQDLRWEGRRERAI